MAPEMLTHVAAVYAYDHHMYLLSTGPPVPEGKRGVVYLMDKSHSMESRIGALRNTAAALTHSQPALGALAFPRVSGGTAIVGPQGCIAQAKRAHPGCDIFLFTDGEETTFQGALEQGVNVDTGEVITVQLGVPGGFPMNTNEYRDAVAAHLEYMVGPDVKIFIVGMGNDCRAFLDRALTRANLYVGHVQDDDSPASILATTRVLQARARGPRALCAPSGAPPLLLSTAPEVEALVAGFSPGDIVALRRAATATTVAGVPSAPPALDAAHVKGVVENLLASNAVKERASLTEDDKRLFHAVLCVAGEAMCAGPVPGNAFSGKYNAMLALGNSNLKFVVNHAFSVLSMKDAGRLFDAKGKTPDGGAEMTVNGTVLKFPAKCPMYQSRVAADVWKELADDASWARPRAQLEAGRGVKRQRSAGASSSADAA